MNIFSNDDILNYLSVDMVHIFFPTDYDKAGGKVGGKVGSWSSLGIKVVRIPFFQVPSSKNWEIHRHVRNK